jgi:hypothetical protein
MAAIAIMTVCLGRCNNGITNKEIRSIMLHHIFCMSLFVLLFLSWEQVWDFFFTLPHLLLSYCLSMPLHYSALFYSGSLHSGLGMWPPHSFVFSVATALQPSILHFLSWLHPLVNTTLGDYKM